MLLPRHIARIEEFSHLPLVELQGLAQRAHLLCIPRGRWIIHNPKFNSGYLYLLRGKIELFSPNRIFKSRRHSQFSYFFPGCEKARTLTASQIIYIDSRQRDFLLNHQTEQFMLDTGTLWLDSFLQNQMMRRLGKPQWQQIVKHFKREHVLGGSTIIKAGTQGEKFYVIERGHAVVQQNNTTKAHLGPGDLFGEDALISGQLRNADVFALEDMWVQTLSQELFTQHLLNAVVRFTPRVEGKHVLNIGPYHIPGTQTLMMAQVREHAQGLDPRTTYSIVGAKQEQRALCAFLLIQRGIIAHPVLDEQYRT